MSDLGEAPVSSIHAHQYIILGGRVCQVSNINHNGSEYHIAAHDVFEGGDDLEADIPDGSAVGTVTVHRNEFGLVNVDDGFLHLTTQAGDPIDDVKLPEGDLGKQITQDFEEGKELIVAVIEALGHKKAISVREATHAE